MVFKGYRDQPATLYIVQTQKTRPAAHAVLAESCVHHPNPVRVDRRQKHATIRDHQVGRSLERIDNDFLKIFRWEHNHISVCTESDVANNDRRKLDSIAAELKRKGTAVIRSAQTETERPIQHWIPHGLHFDDRDESAIVKFKREIVEANRRLDIARKTRRLEKAKETGRRWIEAGVPIFPGAFWEDLAK